MQVRVHILDPRGTSTSTCTCPFVTPTEGRRRAVILLPTCINGPLSSRYSSAAAPVSPSSPAPCRSFPADQPACIAAYNYRTVQRSFIVCRHSRAPSRLALFLSHVRCEIRNHPQDNACDPDLSSPDWLIKLIIARSSRHRARGHFGRAAHAHPPASFPTLEHRYLLPRPLLRHPPTVVVDILPGPFPPSQAFGTPQH